MKWRSLEELSSTADVRLLAEVFAERKQLIAKYVSAEIRAVHDRVVRELQESGLAAKALQAGNKAPEFALTDHNGNLVRSSDVLRDSRLVGCFFRGRWCPFCVGQLEAMNSIAEQLRNLRASLVAISPQTGHQSYLMADQHHLRFPLLSDPGNVVAKKFGLVYRVPEYQQEVYRSAFVNLPFANGDSSWELPIPGTYVLDYDSTVLYAKANTDYAQRPEPRELLEFLAQLPA